MGIFSGVGSIAKKSVFGGAVSGKTPKKPAKTAEELALEKRTQIALDKSIGDQEDMLKALSRGTLGRVSLLSGAPKTTQEAAGGKKPGSAGGAGSLLGGGQTSGGAIRGQARESSGRSLMSNK